MIHATKKYKSKNNYAEWTQPDSKEYKSYYLIYIKIYKIQLIYCDRKRSVVAWGGVENRVRGGEGTKAHEQTFGNDAYVHLLVYGNDFMCRHICQTYQIVCFNYTVSCMSIKPW